MDDLMVKEGLMAMEGNRGLDGGGDRETDNLTVKEGSMKMESDVGLNSGGNGWIDSNNGEA